MKSRPPTIFSSRERSVELALRTLDLIALVASFPIAYLVRDRIFGEKYIRYPGLYPIGQYWLLPLATMIFWIGASDQMRLYRSDRLRGAAAELHRVTRVLIIVAAITTTLAFLTKQGAVSRLFVGFFFVVSMGLLVGNRLLMRWVLHSLHRNGFSTRVIAVVGTSELARDIGQAIGARREWGYHLAGYIEQEPNGGTCRVGPLLGSLSRLEQILSNRVLDEIIFATPQERLSDIQSAARSCNKWGVTARVCLDPVPHRVSRLSLDELNGFPLLDFH
ncbi:MAG TPA: hypothetical protein VMK12_19450 [Anaeromyxobacteraceae bacterium]|nr:hypothetical protein [Anaeromyxobacteraceae bacterium]